MSRPPRSPLVWLAVALLLAAYAAVLARYRGNFELTRTDGFTVMRARAVIEDGYRPLYGAMSSQGIPTAPYAVYLHALWYRLHPSISAIQTGIFANILLTQLIALLLVLELATPLAAAVASLLFFFQPALFVFYNQKFWQCCYLPLSVTLALYLSLRCVRTCRPGYLPAAFLAAGLAVGFHYSAVLLLPLVFVLPAFCRPGKVTTAAIALGEALLLLAVSPFLAWCWTSAPACLPLTVAACMIPFAAHLWPSRARRSLNAAALVALPLCGALAWIARPGLPGLAGFLDLLPAANGYLARHVGSPWSASAVPERLSLSALLLAGYFVFALGNWRRLADDQKLLFYWCWIPLWLLAPCSLVFRDFPHHWFLFLFPAPLIAVASLLDARRWRRPALRRCWGAAVGVLIACYCVASISLARFVERSGGIAWHLATLQTRRRALDWIYAQDPHPKIRAAVDPAIPWYEYGIAGWTATTRESRPLDPGATRGRYTFYIDEAAGLGASPGKGVRLRSRSPALVQEIGPVTVYGFLKAPGEPGIDISDVKPPVSNEVD